MNETEGCAADDTLSLVLLLMLLIAFWLGGDLYIFSGNGIITLIMAHYTWFPSLIFPDVLQPGSDNTVKFVIQAFPQGSYMVWRRAKGDTGKGSSRLAKICSMKRKLAVGILAVQVGSAMNPSRWIQGTWKWLWTARTACQHIQGDGSTNILFYAHCY